MKKNLLISTLIFSLCLITGCSKEENTSLDLQKLEVKIDELNDGVFKPVLVDADSMEEFTSSLNYIYDFEYEKLFDLDSDLVTESDSSVKYNSETKELLAIIKAADEDNDEEIKSSMEAFCNKLNSCLITEFNGYLIYISSSDNDGVLEKIKNTNSKIFNNMMTFDDELFESTTGISTDLVEEYLMKVPMMMTSSSTYIIVKPTENGYDEVKKLLDEYMKTLESTWQMYLPDQYDLVKNRLVKEYGDYLIYIISSDNELVYNAVVES